MKGEIIVKFSRSLLSVGEVGDRVFNGSIDKAKELLSSIFGIDFECGGDGIKDFSINYGTNVFTTVFEYLGRSITAKLSYIPVNDDIVQDILEIIEEPVTVLTKSKLSDDFKKAVNTAMDILEEKFDINFTPMDLDEKDANIKEIRILEPESMTISFIHDDQEGEFTAAVFINEGFYNLSVIHLKKHIVFFD